MENGEAAQSHFSQVKRNQLFTKLLLMTNYFLMFCVYFFLPTVGIWFFTVGDFKLKVVKQTRVVVASKQLHIHNTISICSFPTLVHLKANNLKFTIFWSLTLFIKFSIHRVDLIISMAQITALGTVNFLKERTSLAYKWHDMAD